MRSYAPEPTLFETALSVPPKSAFDWINPIEPQSTPLSEIFAPISASLSSINALPVSRDPHISPLTLAVNPSWILGSAVSPLSPIDSLPLSSDVYASPATAAFNPSGILGGAVLPLSPIDSLPLSSDVYASPATAAFNSSGILGSAMSPLSSIDSLSLSSDVYGSPTTAALNASGRLGDAMSPLSSIQSLLQSSDVASSITDHSWSSPIPSNPLQAGAAYRSALASLPRPINFLDPFASLASDPLHGGFIEARWPTSTLGLGNPYSALADVFEASRLTTLTNDLLLPCVTARGPAASRAFGPVYKDFQETSSHYADFLRAAENSTFEPMLVAIPARGYFASGDAFLQFQGDWVISPPLQRTRESAREEIQQRTESRLEVLLKKVDPRLPKLWRGARITATSTNPDKTRHASASLRELMTQVLHILAPDEAVRRWTSDPRHFPNGKPSRESRLLYICQSIANGALSDYILAEIRSVIALHNVLQKGTHGIDADFSPLQFRLIFNRIEGTICSLIEIREESE
jgi:hypothetical protein